MKADIHPEYVEATVRCSCGNTFTTRSTQGRPPRRALQRVPPLLHRQAEAGGHRWPHRAVRAPLRQAPQVAAAPVSRRRRRPAVPLDPEQRARAARRQGCGALVADHLGVDPPRTTSSCDQARSPAVPRVARRVDRAGSCSTSDPTRALGRGPGLGATATASTELHVVADDADAAACWPAGPPLFAGPPAVWRVEGRALRAVDAGAGRPPPVEPPPVAAASWSACCSTPASTSSSSTAWSRGEVRGLEVARVVGRRRRRGPRSRSASAATTARPSPWSTATCPPPTPLAPVVDSVRHVGAAAAPRPTRCNRLAPERWLRGRARGRPRAGRARPRSRPAEPAVPPRQREGRRCRASPSATDADGRAGGGRLLGRHRPRPGARRGRRPRSPSTPRPAWCSPSPSATTTPSPAASPPRLRRPGRGRRPSRTTGAAADRERDPVSMLERLADLEREFDDVEARLADPDVHRRPGRATPS